MRVFFCVSKNVGGSCRYKRFFFSSRRRHTSYIGDWSSDVCSSDLFEPRLFFPDKPYIISDSEMVRKYSGVMVAGEEKNTDIAFGYAAESYIDFGVPGMFVPMFLWSLFIGAACQLVFREYHHRDMAVSVVTVIGWFTLYLFERSWTKNIGFGGSLLIYAGGLCYVLDRLWLEKLKQTYAGRLSDAGALVETDDEARPQLHQHIHSQSSLFP